MIKPEVMGREAQATAAKLRKLITPQQNPASAQAALRELRAVDLHTFFAQTHEKTVFTLFCQTVEQFVEAKGEDQVQLQEADYLFDAALILAGFFPHTGDERFATISKIQDEFYLVYKKIKREGKPAEITQRFVERQEQLHSAISAGGTIERQAVALCAPISPQTPRVVEQTDGRRDQKAEIKQQGNFPWSHRQTAQDWKNEGVTRKDARWLFETARAKQVSQEGSIPITDKVIVQLVKKYDLDIAHATFEDFKNPWIVPWLTSNSNRKTSELYEEHARKFEPTVRECFQDERLYQVLLTMRNISNQRQERRKQGLPIEGEKNLFDAATLQLSWDPATRSQVLAKHEKLRDIFLTDITIQKKALKDWQRLTREDFEDRKQELQALVIETITHFYWEPAAIDTKIATESFIAYLYTILEHIDPHSSSIPTWHQIQLSRFDNPEDGGLPDDWLPELVDKRVDVAGQALANIEPASTEAIETVDQLLTTVPYAREITDLAGRGMNIRKIAKELKMPIQDVVRIQELLQARLRQMGLGYESSRRRVDRQRSIEDTKNFANALNEYLVRESALDAHRTLTTRQTKVIEAIRDALKKGNPHFSIVKPTGTGKSVIAAEVAEALNVKTLIAVPTIIATEQMKETLAKFAPDLPVGLVNGEVENDFNKTVTVITYDSLTKAIDEGTIDPSVYRLTIFDEAHRALSDLRKTVIHQFDNSIRIALTATPAYSEAKHIAKVFGEIIHKTTVKEEVLAAELASVSVVFARVTNADLSNVSIIGNDYDQGELELALDNGKVYQGAVELYLKTFPGRSLIVFCAGVDTAENVAKLFNLNFQNSTDSQMNVLHAEAVSSRDGKKARKSKLEGFDNGAIQVLISDRLVEEAFDTRRADVIFLIAPTMSLIRVVQRPGRGLRTDPRNPFKHTYIVEWLYPNKDLMHGQHSFVQVLGQAEVFQGGKEPTSKLHGKLQARRWHHFGGYDKLNLPFVSGLEVIVDPVEVMRIAHDLESGQDGYLVPKAEEGLRTKGEMREYLSVTYGIKMSSSTIERYIKRYEELSQEVNSGKLRRASNGLILPHYSTEILQFILGEIQAIPYAPERWAVAGSLAKRVKESTGIRPDLETIKYYAEIFTKANQDVITKNIYRERRHNTVAEHYSPEFIDFFEQEVKSISIAPQGWKTKSKIIKDLKKLVGVSFNEDIFDALVKEYENLHPTIIMRQAYRRKNKFILDIHYAPEIDSYVVEKAKKHTIAPSGWMTRKRLQQHLIKLGIKVGDNKIKKLIEQYIEDHSSEETAKLYRGKTNQRIYLHYSPEVVAFVVKELSATVTK